MQDDVSATISTRNVVLFGKGELAIRVANWFLKNSGWRLSYIIPVIPEPHWTASLMHFAQEHDVLHIESGKFDDIPDNGKFDLGISIFYDKIFDANFLSRFGLFLNLHNSPLPHYRGVRPVNWALENGEQFHGVTLHKVTPEIDAGPIFAQATFSIYPEIDEVEDVYRRGLEFAWTLFTQTMPILDRISPRPQDPAHATYYSARDAERLTQRSGHRRMTATKDHTEAKSRGNAW